MLFNINKIKFSESQLETSVSKGFEELYWDDLRAPATGINPVGQVSPPTVNSVDGSLVFDVNNAVCVWFQMPYSWKIGSNLYPYIHCSKSTSIFI